MNILCLTRLEHPKKRFSTNQRTENIFANYENRFNVVIHNANINLSNYFKKLDYHLIILFSSFLSARNDENLFSKILKEYSFLGQSKACKIAMPQDDYECSELLDNWMCSWNIDKLYTVCPDKWDLLYPKLIKRGVIELGYTGYISKSQIKYWEKTKGFNKRDIDIFYRASTNNISINYGKIRSLKKEIAETFLKNKDKLASYNIDISHNKNDLLFGNQWFDRLSNSKFCLVTPSGSSLHDPKGIIREKIIKYIKNNPNSNFQNIEKNCFSNLDMKDIFTMISPRNIEAALSKTVQIAFVDSYSKIMKPNIHYIALEKDYSNLDAVIKKLSNKEIYDNISQKCKEKFLSIKELREEYLIDKIIKFAQKKTDMKKYKKYNKKYFIFQLKLLRIKEKLYWRFHLIFLFFIRLIKNKVSPKNFQILKIFYKKYFF